MSSPVPEPQTLLAWLNSRVSVRQFKPEPLSRPLLDRILEMAARAPSAHNCQPWRFLALESVEARQRLIDAMAPDYLAALKRAGLDKAEIEVKTGKRAKRILGAAVGVLLCYVAEEMESYPDDPHRQQGEDLMGVQSVALAGGQLLLAAHSQGLGGVWVGAPLFTQQAIRQEFELPQSWQPQGLLLLGYPAESPASRQRRPLQEVARYY